MAKKDGGKWKFKYVNFHSCCYGHTQVRDGYWVTNNALMTLKHASYPAIADYSKKKVINMCINSDLCCKWQTFEDIIFLWFFFFGTHKSMLMDEHWGRAWNNSTENWHFYRFTWVQLFFLRFLICREAISWIGITIVSFLCTTQEEEVASISSQKRKKSWEPNVLFGSQITQ